MEALCARLLAPNQTAFVRGRFILESVVATHQIIHDAVKQDKKGMVLMLDYERAYDRVDWHFLKEMLISRCFGPKWIRWIMCLVEGGSISIRVNDEISPYFKPGKGLRQGDPLSPLLFNVVIDVFSRMLVKAARRGYISRFINSLSPEGVISLQYSYDTLIFLNHDYGAACYLRWVMVCFEQISGMKINYHKSDLT
jgi:hypothetical protein